MRASLKRSGVSDGRVIHLPRPRSARVLAGHARRVRAADGVLRIVVVEAVEVRAQHQRLIRRELMIEASVEKRLPVVAGVMRGRRSPAARTPAASREERRPILPRVVGGEEEERPVLHDRTAEGAGVLAQRIGDVDRIDGRERRRRHAGRNRRRAEAAGRERLRLHAAEAVHVQQLRRACCSCPTS